MPLTNEEREFLDAYVYEATHEPFGGPATTDLRGRGLYYADLHGLLTAYHRELSVEGTSPFGKPIAKPRACPWPDRDTAIRRNRDLVSEHVLAATNGAGPYRPPGEKQASRADSKKGPANFS